MSKELKMEVFASKEPVKSVRLHVYEFHTSELYENKYRLIRSAAWKIRNVNACGVFEDGSYIYTTEKISEEIPNVNFRLTYLGEQELGVLEHKKVYSELIKHWIIQKLRTVKIQKNSKEYYKYACRSNVTSRWIQTEQGFQTFYSGNRQISLERKYNFTVKILDDGRAYLKIDTSSVFLSNQTVYDYITQGMNPIGMEVKNEWGKNNQTGILTEICDYTVVDKIDFADSLKAYYTDMKKEGYRVENLPDQTPVVRVELQAGKIYPYYPQALKPVLTREKVGQIDARFSMTIEKYIKRDMITRIELDKDFIRDIGSIAQLGDLEFENDMCNVKELGYLKGKVESPALTCGQGKRLRCGEEFKVFNYGFYQKPDEKIKIGYIYPKNTVDLIKAVVNGICEFAAYGKYQGEKDAYIIPGLLDIQMKPMIKEEYELGDITDYKRAAQRLRKVEGIDIVIAINAFSEKEKVQILHVMKNNQVSTIQRIDNYFSKSELLNDLDIRASDLLQSNGIVWVEGPSDRVYVKRWIELEGIKFQEGRDYQFMYYGGRLLSHYTMKEADDMINVLMTNRNAAILIDSDKRTKNSRINDTKKRIREEFQSNNMFCWITKGKEIENYIPWEAINKKYPRIDKQCGEYELFPEYIKTVYSGFVQSKVKFAKEICPYITKENSSELLDLQKNIKLLIEQIKKWNKI